MKNFGHLHFVQYKLQPRANFQKLIQLSDNRFEYSLCVKKFPAVHSECKNKKDKNINSVLKNIFTRNILQQIKFYAIPQIERYDCINGA